jgi:hypothetical protein
VFSPLEYAAAALFFADPMNFAAWLITGVAGLTVGGAILMRTNVTFRRRFFDAPATNAGLKQSSSRATDATDDRSHSTAAA